MSAPDSRDFGAAWPDFSYLRTSSLSAAGHILDSYVVIMAGLLLIIPGLISDVIELLLLVPPVRRWCIRRVVPELYEHPLVSGRDRRVEPRQPTVIDGTYERRDPDVGER